MGNTACCGGSTDNKGIDVVNPNDNKDAAENSQRESSRKGKPQTPIVQSKPSSARKQKEEVNKSEELKVSIISQASGNILANQNKQSVKANQMNLTEI